MRHFVRVVLTSVASVAFTVPLAVAFPAQAASYNPLSERGLETSSLGAGDVPRWMSRGTTPKVKHWFVTGSNAGGPPLCVDQAGLPIEGRQARQWMNSRVATGQGREIQTDIYQYRTRETAVRAWSNLNSLAAECEGRKEIDLSAEGISTKIVVNTEVNQTRPLFGTSGLTLFLDFNAVVDAFDTEFAFVGDSYVSYYLAGTSIVSVSFSSSTESRGLGRVTRGFVDTMSIVVAQRVERRSLR